MFDKGGSSPRPASKFITDCLIYKNSKEMARIIYKDGCEGQNRLECIEGIEIGLLNGQKALVYPKYSEEALLNIKDRSKCEADCVTEIEALRLRDNTEATSALVEAGSPAAVFVGGFLSVRFGRFALPTLLAALEITAQKSEIDELAKAIDGADLLEDYSGNVWSCSRYYSSNGWFANGSVGYAIGGYLYHRYVAVPLVLLDAAAGAA